MQWKATEGDNFDDSYPLYGKSRIEVVHRGGNRAASKLDPKVCFEPLFRKERVRNRAAREEDQCKTGS